MIRFKNIYLVCFFFVFSPHTVRHLVRYHLLHTSIDMKIDRYTLQFSLPRHWHNAGPLNPLLWGRRDDNPKHFDNLLNQNRNRAQQKLWLTRISQIFSLLLHNSNSYNNKFLMTGLMEREEMKFVNANPHELFFSALSGRW